MTKIFAPSIIARQLEIKMFNEPCVGYYLNDDQESDDNDVTLLENMLRNSDLVNDAFTAPTYLQVIDWLREKHHIHFNIMGGLTDYHIRIRLTGKVESRALYGSYYEAIDKAIKEALKLI